MLGRCRNSSSPKFPHYGGRGIRVCDRWLSFENFYADMGPRPSPDYQIERIDNNGDYCPENCCWIHKSRQASNRRSSRLLAHNGMIKTVADWAKEKGFRRHVIYDRLKDGWSIQKAIETPVCQ